MKTEVKIKISSMDEFEKVINELKEIERVNPHMSVDIEVDCREKYDTDSGCKYTDRPDN